MPSLLKIHGGARGKGREVCQRAFCRCPQHLHHRSDDAGRKGFAERYFPLLGTELRQAFDVQFVNKENKLEYVWATSWGVSTRLMGALIMTHSDDNGLVLPPHLAPIQVVIVPIYKNAEMLAKIDEKVAGIVAKLKSMGISVKYDNADNKRPGFKFADYEVKGVPVRLVMGGRDLENNTMEIMRRDTLEKETRSCEGIEEYVKDLLEDIQANVYKKALDYRNSRITSVDSYEEFKEKIEEGGFILAHWDGTTETEEKSRKRPKQPSVVFLSIHLFRVTRNRASVWLPASLLPAA